ncbi:loganic acid O-methyltransferase-like [Humulus lupulus]|uniref:loganic acid O-methyltransferase-like n=1 Tax=Humulus lupulus TaxID=3486 RepID=UPI002B4034FF|nr:loganic acid O-methyltransferase-like [Humulus lupulus]
MEESFPMTGGDGPYSYAKNSNPQKEAAENAKALLVAAITENLEINKQKICPISSSFRIVDFGCSTGPNTFIAVDTIIEAVSKTFQDHVPEFHVFFSDHVSNDFNILFTNLPKDRTYFAAGVPGSFHRRLFPRASLNLAYSSHALQWLSKTPAEVEDSSSPAFNKGKIFYAKAAEQVGEAYRRQHEEDMASFFNARSEELAPGGLLAILMSGREDGSSPAQSSLGPVFAPLESTLVDMANEGIISHGKLDSFNLPIFSPSPEEIKKIIQKNGCFEISRLELQPRTFRPMITVEQCRAGFESIISKHFNDNNNQNIIDQLFNRYSKKIEGCSPISADDKSTAAGLFLLLKRKS